MFCCDEWDIFYREDLHWRVWAGWSTKPEALQTSRSFLRSCQTLIRCLVIDLPGFLWFQSSQSCCDLLWALCSTPTVGTQDLTNLDIIGMLTLQQLVCSVILLQDPSLCTVAFCQDPHPPRAPTFSSDLWVINYSSTIHFNLPAVDLSSQPAGPGSLDLGSAKISWTISLVCWEIWCLVCQKIKRVITL